MRTASALLALVLFLPGCGTEEVEVFEQPDLIFVVIDTWRWDRLGANGSPRADITPNLDQLAEGGVRFSRAFTSSPWTGSSVGTMFTGQLPTVHGVYGRFADVGSLRPSVPTLPELLKEAGYATLGVVNGFFLNPKYGFDRGFDLYDFVPSTNKKIRRAARSVDLALDRLREARNDGPVFLFLHVFDPHLAYDPPRRWRRTYTPEYHGMFKDLNAMRSGSFDPSPEELDYILGLYDAEVSYVDEQLGRFFEELDEVLPGRERLVVLTADHGEEFGEHGAWEHGQAMYRELVQVPLVVVPPASRPARGVVDAQVPLVDLLPTFLDAAGLGLPEGLPYGPSLLPWGDGSRTEDLPVYSEREHLGPVSASYRDGKYALIHYLDEGRSELYDQIADPAETEDLAPKMTQLTAEMFAKLQGLAGLLEKQAAKLESHEAPELDPEELNRMRNLGYTDGKVDDETGEAEGGK